MSQKDQDFQMDSQLLPHQIQYNRKPQVDFPTERLEQALFESAEVLQAAATQFILTEWTALGAWAGMLTGEKVTLGITSNWLDPKSPETAPYQSAVSVIRANFPKLEISDDELRFQINGVPVVIKIIRPNQEEHKFFTNPDSILYKGVYIGENHTWYEDFYFLPNPMTKYVEFIKQKEKKNG